MADSGNPMNQESAPKKKREISMEARLLLAFILMGGVLFVTQFWNKNNAPAGPNPATANAGKQLEQKTTPPAPPAPAPAAAASPKPVAGSVAAGAEQTYILDT